MRGQGKLKHQGGRVMFFGTRRGWRPCMETGASIVTWGRHGNPQRECRIMRRGGTLDHRDRVSQFISGRIYNSCMRMGYILGAPWMRSLHR